MRQQLESFIQSYIDNHSIMGTSIAILQDGNTVYKSGFGTTSVEGTGGDVTDQTLFAYGSIAKNVCALLIMRLVEQRLLELDSPILQYLPNSELSNQQYAKRITLRHLLSHTSGLPAAGKDFGPRDRDSLERFVFEQIPHYKFLAEPGAVHLYSSAVICIAGHIAEVVTGKWYDDLADELVFKPLAMNRTTFDPTVAMTYSVALPHEASPNGMPYVNRPMFYNVSGNPSGFGYTSVSDLANLAQMYLNDGKFGDRQFLEPSSVVEMQKMEKSRHVECTVNPHGYSYLGYGLGFETGSYRGKRVVGHGGMQLSFNCFFKLFPDERSGVIVLTNYSKDRPLWEMVTSLYDRTLNLPPARAVSVSKFRPQSILLDKPILQRFEGSFINVESADLVCFEANGKQLLLKRKDEDALQLEAVGNNQFCSEVTSRYLLPVVFVDEPNGEIMHVMIGGEPYFPIELDSEFESNPHLWKKLEGIYKDPTNANVDELLSVKLCENDLCIREGTLNVNAIAVSNACFLSEIGLIEFEDLPDDKGKILILGKAVRYFPLNEDKYSLNGVIQYAVDIPYQVGLPAANEL